jgi:hypothetical protein
MQSQNRFMKAGLLFPALAMLPAIAVADTYPGATCQPSSPSDQFIRNADGRMFNVDPKGKPRQFWICPIKSSVGTFPNGQIVVIDQNSEATISCSMCQATANANASTRCLTKTTESFDPSREPRTLSFQFSTQLISPNAYTFFGCLIPNSDNNNQSGVVSYSFGLP